MEQTRSFAGQAFALAGYAEILTRESAANDIDWRKLRGIDLANISVYDGVRKSMAQNLLRVLVPLDTPSDLESGSFKAEVETADAGEHRSDSEFHFVSSPEPQEPP